MWRCAVGVGACCARCAREVGNKPCLARANSKSNRSVERGSPNGVRNEQACRLRAPAVHRAGRREDGGCLRLGASLSHPRLATFPIEKHQRCIGNLAEGKAGCTTEEHQRCVGQHRWKRQRPQSISDTASAFGAGWLGGLLRFDGLRGLRFRFLLFDFRVHLGVHRIPSADAHQHAVGVFDGVHMAIMLLNHFH